MQEKVHRCYNRIGKALKCPFCTRSCIRYGKTGSGKERFRCKACKQTSINNYTNKAYTVFDISITCLLKEGCGIRSIGRLLSISVTTVLKRILSIAKSIEKPCMSLYKSYEVDEMCTYYQKKSKLLWIVYALRKDTREVVDFAVGPRNKLTLQKVTDTLVMSESDRIYTDKLNLYGYIIPVNIHCTDQYSINHIERKNLSLWTHMKRLNRRTICFSKSIAMLSACLKIYFWSRE